VHWAGETSFGLVIEDRLTSLAVQLGLFNPERVERQTSVPVIVPATAGWAPKIFGKHLSHSHLLLQDWGANKNWGQRPTSPRNLHARSLVRPASTFAAKEKGAHRPPPEHGDGTRAPRRGPFRVAPANFPCYACRHHKGSPYGARLAITPSESLIASLLFVPVLPGMRGRCHSSRQRRQQSTALLTLIAAVCNCACRPLL
jgi:hypothetical protein